MAAAKKSSSVSTSTVGSTSYHHSTTQRPSTSSGNKSASSEAPAGSTKKKGKHKIRHRVYTIPETFESYESQSNSSVSSDGSSNKSGGGSSLNSNGRSNNSSISVLPSGKGKSIKRRHSLVLDSTETESYDVSDSSYASPSSSSSKLSSWSGGTPKANQETQFSSGSISKTKKFIKRIKYFPEVGFKMVTDEDVSTDASRMQDPVSTLSSTMPSPKGSASKKTRSNLLITIKRFWTDNEAIDYETEAKDFANDMAITRVYDHSASTEAPFSSSTTVDGPLSTVTVENLSTTSVSTEFNSSIVDETSTISMDLSTILTTSTVRTTKKKRKKKTRKIYYTDPVDTTLTTTFTITTMTEVWTTTPSTNHKKKHKKVRHHVWTDAFTDDAITQTGWAGYKKKRKILNRRKEWTEVEDYSAPDDETTTVEGSGTITENSVLTFATPARASKRKVHVRYWTDSFEDSEETLLSASKKKLKKRLNVSGVGTELYTDETEEATVSSLGDIKKTKRPKRRIIHTYFYTDATQSVPVISTELPESNEVNAKSNESDGKSKRRRKYSLTGFYTENDEAGFAKHMSTESTTTKRSNRFRYRVYTKVDFEDESSTQVEKMRKPNRGNEVYNVQEPRAPTVDTHLHNAFNIKRKFIEYLDGHTEWLANPTTPLSKTLRKIKHGYKKICECQDYEYVNDADGTIGVAHICNTSEASDPNHNHLNLHQLFTEADSNSRAYAAHSKPENHRQRRARVVTDIDYETDATSPGASRSNVLKRRIWRRTEVVTLAEGETFAKTEPVTSTFASIGDLGLEQFMNTSSTMLITEEISHNSIKSLDTSAVTKNDSSTILTSSIAPLISVVMSSTVTSSSNTLSVSMSAEPTTKEGTSSSLSPSTVVLSYSSDRGLTTKSTTST